MPDANTLGLRGSHAPTRASSPESVPTVSSSKKGALEHNHGKPDVYVNGGAATPLLDEDPFSSEASKALFDGVDKLRGCGAAVDLDLPQVRLLTTIL